MRALILTAAILLAACGKTPAKQPENAPALPAAAPAPAGVTGGFVPLQSAAVKDAIHQALVTGENQRWQDGTWSGYAVPSRETMANGCRTVRYTVDQQPDAAAATINACDAGRGGAAAAP